MENETEDLYPRQFHMINDSTSRMKVPGGWLVNFYGHISSMYHSDALCGSITFLPDPNYEWTLEPQGKKS